MANAQHGEVDIEVGGKTYTLRLGVNELCELQAALGLADDDEKFMTIYGQARFMRSLSVMRQAVRIAVGVEIMSLVEAGSLITEYGFIKMQDAIGQCIKWSMPPSKPSTGGEARPSPGPRS